MATNVIANPWNENKVAQEKEGESGEEPLESVCIDLALFSREFYDIAQSKGGEYYCLFKPEPLHNLYIEISKLVRVCTGSYLPVDRIRTGVARKRTESFDKTRELVRQGCNRFISSLKSIGKFSGTRIILSKRGLVVSNGIFARSTLLGMMEGKGAESQNRFFLA